ncbi:MAG TPA: hypothetical protein VHH11_13220 [Gammaproteobacteria bacterium]|nr:hypothetical protein [Gammaproteobacteria bacterium]
MRTLTCCSVAAVAGCFAIAAAACESPSLVAIPEGKTSTLEQMLAAQKDVKAYQAKMNEYLACIDAEADTQGEKAPAEYKALMVNRHNAAVAEMEGVAAAFNDQIKAYKAANPAPAK